jgi:hypothetical protein
MASSSKKVAAAAVDLSSMVTALAGGDRKNTTNIGSARARTRSTKDYIGRRELFIRCFVWPSFCCTGNPKKDEDGEDAAVAKIDLFLSYNPVSLAPVSNFSH